MHSCDHLCDDSVCSVVGCLQSPSCGEDEVLKDCAVNVEVFSCNFLLMLNSPHEL